MIKVEQLCKVFRQSKKMRRESNSDSKNLTVVDNINFECKPGRIFSLLGANGAGKTTILRMLATILKPTSGKATVANYDTVDEPLEVRKRIGFLTGSTGLYQRLTPDELIRYFANIYRIEKFVFQKRKKELFGVLGIDSFANKRIGQLSTGMKQKVSIARTMIHNPDVLVFDEPTSGLDVITSKNIVELILRSREAGRTVIFSSHIMSEVDLLCDDIAIIHKGKLVYNNSMDLFRANMKTKSLTEEFINIIKE